MTNSTIRFLVTGGAGFIGSNLCEFLLEKGHFVRCFDNLTTGKKENIEEFLANQKFEFIYGDIRNSKDCEQAMQGIDYVFHEAALGSVPRSLKEPKLYCENNILGFLNVLEAARNNKVKRVVYASSSSVYGDSTSLPKKEGEEGLILSPYALTKENNEKWAGIYTKYYGLQTIGLRYFNVFGPKQNPDGMYAAVIPKFINSVKNGNRPIIFGDGLQSRDFTFVKNVVNANYLACFSDNDSVGKCYNIASSQRIFLNDLYRMIANEFGLSEDPIYESERLGDIRDSFADITLANYYLKYKPEYSFEEGLLDTIKWYREISYAYSFSSSNRTGKHNGDDKHSRTRD